MADKKQTNNGKRGTGFGAPTIGVVLSKNSVIKKNPDGTLSVTEPKRKKK